MLMDLLRDVKFFLLLNWRSHFTRSGIVSTTRKAREELWTHERDANWNGIFLTYLVRWTKYCKIVFDEGTSWKNKQTIRSRKELLFLRMKYLKGWFHQWQQNWSHYKPLTEKTKDWFLVLSRFRAWDVLKLNSRKTKFSTSCKFTEICHCTRTSSGTRACHNDPSSHRFHRSSYLSGGFSRIFLEVFWLACKAPVRVLKLLCRHQSIQRLGAPSLNLFWSQSYGYINDGWKGKIDEKGKMKEWENKRTGKWRNKKKNELEIEGMGKGLFVPASLAHAKWNIWLHPLLKQASVAPTSEHLVHFWGMQYNKYENKEINHHKLFQRADKGAKFSLFLLPFLFLFGLFVFCFVFFFKAKKSLDQKKNPFGAKPLHCNELCTHSVGLISIFRQIGIRQYSALLP